MMTMDEINRIPDSLKLEISLCLEYLRNTLVESLVGIVNYSYPDEVATIQFEVFIDDIAKKFPVRKFIFDEFNNEYFLETDIETEVINNSAPIVTEEMIEKWNLEYKIENLEYLLILNIIKWFSDCFEFTNYISYAKKYFIRIHDSSWNFDLVAKKWVKII